MAEIFSPKVSRGDMYSPLQQKSQRDAASKKNSKPMKSNITNKMKSKHAGVATSGNVQSEDEDEDDSANEDSKNDEDADAFALSGRQKHNAKSTRSLAGLRSKNKNTTQDVGMTDADQAVAGAEKGVLPSDDEDYADVENVSDSDGEGSESESEDTVLRSAEQDLIAEFQKAEQRRDTKFMTNDMNGMAIRDEEALAKQLGLYASDVQTDEFGFEVDMDADPFLGLSKDGDQYTQMWNDAETALWRMPDTARTRESSDPSATNQKRVRFEEETRSRSPSRSDSEEDPNETFPDLLAAADHPVTRQPEYEYGIQYSDFNDAESFYDFEDEDEKLAFEIDEESDSDEASSDDSDSEGETTDEETAEETIAKLQERKAACKVAKSTPPPGDKRPTPVSSRITSSSNSRPTTPKDGRGPRTGTFAVDPTRASMISDPEGRNIQILPPAKPLEKDKAFWERARTASNSRAGSPRNNGYLTVPSPQADSMPPRPFTAQSTLGSMFNGNLDILRNNDTPVIAEDLLPRAMSRPQSSFTSFSTTEDSESDRLADSDIRMQDFVDLGDGDSDSEGPPSGAITSPGAPDMFDAALSPMGRERRSSDLLGHFDQFSGVVGSFRRNQNLAKQVSSMASHPAKRASAHEYNALQKGRRGAANTPMTPARKKRASQDLSNSSAGVRKNVGSPMTTRRPRSRGNSLVNADLYQTLSRNPLE